MSAFNGVCCAALAAIAKFCAQYAMGISNTIYIIEACDIEAIPAPDAGTHTISTDITLKTGKVWFPWKIAQTNAEFNYSSTGQASNLSFQSVLTFFLPVIRDAIEHLINQIINGEFIIIFADQEGKYRILGTEFAPASIPEDGVNGLINDEQNGTTVTMRQRSGPTPYFYTGAIVTEAA